MVHRDGCGHLRQRRTKAARWDWAEGKTFAELVTAFYETRGYDPYISLCAQCFSGTERLDWHRRVQGRDRAAKADQP